MYVWYSICADVEYTVSKNCCWGGGGWRDGGLIRIRSESEQRAREGRLAGVWWFVVGRMRHRQTSPDGMERWARPACVTLTLDHSALPLCLL